MAAGCAWCGIEAHVAGAETAARADVGEGSAVELDLVPVAGEVKHRVGVRRAVLAEHDTVLARAARDGIVARAAFDPVVALVAVERVVACATEDRVVAASPLNLVVAAVAGDDVVARVAGRVDVIKAPHRKILEIGAERPRDIGEHRVDAAGIVEHVAGAVLAAQDVRVVAEAAVHRVVAAEALKQIVAGRAVENVGRVVARAGRRVVAEKELAAVGERHITRCELRREDARQEDDLAVRRDARVGSGIRPDSFDVQVGGRDARLIEVQNVGGGMELDDLPIGQRTKVVNSHGVVRLKGG